MNSGHCVSSEYQFRSIDPVFPDEAIVSLIVAELQVGNLVVAPTETRYGLLCRADKQSIVDRMYQVKRRPTSKASAIFLPSAFMIPRYAQMPSFAVRLADAFLPGPLTLVLMAQGNAPLPMIESGNIGIRVSSSPLIRAIVESVPFPVTATSANISGEPDHAAIAAIAEQLGGGVSLYIDGGELNGEVSTVVDCTSDSPRVLRAGAIAEQKIMQILTSQS